MSELAVKIRHSAQVASGMVIFLMGAGLVTGLILNGHVAALRLPHWPGAAESHILSGYAAVGWISLLAGFLLLAPAKWFRWLEKPRNSQWY